MARVNLVELGISIEAPEGVKIEESVYGDWASLEAPGFALVLNAFVPEGSAFTASEARGRIPREARILHEEDNDRTWRFDFEMPDGLIGIHMRIVEPRTLDCVIGGRTILERELPLAALRTLRWISA